MASLLKKVINNPLPTTCVQIPKQSEHEKMMAVVFRGKRSVKVECVPKPLITEPKDALVRITLSTICGTDLHLYHNLFPGMQSGDILGHEGVGVVEAIGESVEKLKIGDRVAISSPVSCGECDQCKDQCFSLCQRTNPSREMFTNLGHHRVTGVFGCGQNMGGYAGMQAQYIRVPFADVNCLQIPEDVSDEKAIFLSDVMPTAWHAVEMGQVTPGQTVAVWGCGPIGLMCVKWALHRRAKRVIAIDCQPARLKKAENLGAEVINYKEKNPVDLLAEMIPGGPDVCIDSVGFRYSKTILHSIESAMGMETDVGECIDECIRAVRVGGHVSVIGDYVGYTNHFPVGIMMSKGLTLRSGMQYAQKYWHDLLKLIRIGAVDPTFMVTHDLPLEKSEEVYEMFDKKNEECMKILLRPPAHCH
jgi:threonine dehydrogenase-like Zn-dependent dehydrogenase